MELARIRGAVAGDYEERITAIGTEYDSLPRTGVSPFATRHGFMMRECYLLVRQFKGRPGGADAIKGFSEYEKRDRRQPTYEENPFYWGIKSIRNDFSTSALAFFAKQLKHAENHKVPPEYLIGFLLQMQSHRNRLMRSCILPTEDDFDLFRNKSKHVGNL